MYTLTNTYKHIPIHLLTIYGCMIYS